VLEIRDGWGVQEAKTITWYDPAALAAAAILPVTPGSPKGLSIGMGPLVSCPGARLPPSTSSVTPAATVPATTNRQRRDRSYPSGSSRNSRVMPRVIAGAQPVSRNTTAS
jgi:hypothetical protein